MCEADCQEKEKIQENVRCGESPFPGFHCYHQPSSVLLSVNVADGDVY